MQAGLVQPAASAPEQAVTAPEQAAAAAAATAAAPEAAVEQLLHERQALIAEARRRKATAQEKFAKLSQVCVAADQVSQPCYAPGVVCTEVGVCGWHCCCLRAACIITLHCLTQVSRPQLSTGPSTLVSLPARPPGLPALCPPAGPAPAGAAPAGSHGRIWGCRRPPPHLHRRPWQPPRDQHAPPAHHGAAPGGAPHERRGPGGATRQHPAAAGAWGRWVWGGCGIDCAAAVSACSAKGSWRLSLFLRWSQHQAASAAAHQS